MTFTVSRRGLAGIAAAGATAAGFVISSAQADTLDETLKNNVLRVGIHPNSPPFSSRNAAGDCEGFDVDVANKLAEELKIEKVEFVPTETAQRVPFLVANTIDISLGGLTRNSERAKLIEYTVPLHTEVMGVLTTDKVKIDELQGAQRSEIHPRRRAQRLDHRLGQGEPAQRQAGDRRHQRRRGAHGRAGSRRRDRRDARLLHGLHQEPHGREVAGPARPRSMSAGMRSACRRATMRCATASTSRSTSCMPRALSMPSGRRPSARAMLEKVPYQPYF